MGRLIRKNEQGERGQGLVEFALVIPLFLLLVFAIVDFGMAFHSWITVTNSAREGARIGSVGADAATITQRVKDTAGSLDNSNLSVTVTNAQGASGQDVSVAVTYDYQLITPLSNVIELFSGGGVGSNIAFSSTAHMRLE